MGLRENEKETRERKRGGQEIEREVRDGENKGSGKEEGGRERRPERKRGERKSFDVFSSPERASGRMVDPKLAPLLEGTDWFIKRSHCPHASEHDGINAGITLYLIHYRGTLANLI